MLARRSIAILAALTCCSGQLAYSRPARPNVVIILADDLGFSDLGCYGGEIQTPHVDGLAAGGLRFTQFYNTARCWPSRAALLTGYYAQQVHRDAIHGVPSGAQGKRPAWAMLLPELLRPLGYRSYHAGKWHIDGKPLANGFDRSYHVEDPGRHLHPRVLFEGDRQLPPVKPGTGYGTTTAIADHSIKYLSEHASKYRDQPFLLYIAFDAPHFPLQALPEDIARYLGRYDEGWDATRAERWNRIQKIGLVRGRLSDVEFSVGPPYRFANVPTAFGTGEVNRPLPWKSLTGERRAFQAVKMSIHAAMIDRMDREIGRVIDQVRDGGPRKHDRPVSFRQRGKRGNDDPRRRSRPRPPAGSAGTHLCLGPGWSTVANTPFRRHKTWVHEGGIGTPLIVHWPSGFAARGELRHDAGHVIDIVPTILEVTGADHHQTADTRSIPAPPGKISRRPSIGTDRSSTTNCGGSTKETGPFAWAIGSSLPPTARRGNSTTLQPIAQRPAISRRNTLRRCDNSQCNGPTDGTSSSLGASQSEHRPAGRFCEAGQRPHLSRRIVRRCRTTGFHPDSSAGQKAISPAVDLVRTDVAGIP